MGRWQSMAESVRRELRLAGRRLRLERADWRWGFFLALALYFIVWALLLERPTDIARGLLAITLNSDRLLTDYMAVGGIGAALINAASMILLHVAVLWLWRIRPDAQHVAGLLTVAGFSLFGKNILNGIPLSLGVVSYSLLHHEDPRDNCPNLMFVSCLSPVVTEIWLLWSGLGGILSASLVGFAVGLIFTPLSRAFVNFHQGYSLYNAGFTGGIIAMFVGTVLRSMGYVMPAKLELLRGKHPELLLFLLLLQLATLLAGLLLDPQAWPRFRLLARTTGVNQPNYVREYGVGAVLINAGSLGLFTTLYAWFVGGGLNGPLIGGIFTVMGFSFIGKNLRNALPIFVGVFLTAALSIEDIHSPTAMLAAIFGTTLCPITGYFGPLAGVLAGFLNMSLLSSLGVLNSGLNLYNNGFSGGFIAAFLVPIFFSLKLGRRPELEQHEPHDHAVAHTPAAEAAESFDEDFEP